MKRALVACHVPREGLAGFRAPIEAAGYAVERIVAGGDGFDEADFLGPDLLVLMGGPMAVYERAAHRWIDGEVTRLAARIAAGRPTLGVCLGAQMIAAAMGAAVAPGPVREVGFAPIELTDEGVASPLAGLAGIPVLHWHGDGFTLPTGATLLARTAPYPQAFARGDTLLALQCHPEMGGETDGIGAWIADDEAYLKGAGTSAARVMDEHRRFGAAAMAAGRALLARWLAGLEPARP